MDVTFVFWLECLLVKGKGGIHFAFRFICLFTNKGKHGMIGDK